jgi:hypothetical protein
MKLDFNKEELEAIVATIRFFEKMVSNATPEPEYLTPQKEELFTQLYNVLNKIEKVI